MFKKEVYCLNNKEFVETMKMDIRDLIVSGFQYGMSMDGTLSVTEDDMSIFQINTQGMTLMYPCEINGAWKYIKQTIAIDWQSPSYGNKDCHFICPLCGKRGMTLYHIGTNLICRRCYGLSDQSQYIQYKINVFENLNDAGFQR